MGGYVERRITVSVPDEIYDMMDNMCYEYIDGLKVKRRSLSDVAREMIIKGLKEMLRIEA